jgi:hypothetical protein
MTFEIPVEIGINQFDISLIKISVEAENKEEATEKVTQFLLSKTNLFITETE